MGKIENVWTFYENVVKIIWSREDVANDFLKQAITNMLLEKELEQEPLLNEQIYEMILYYNLGYSNQNLRQKSMEIQEIEKMITMLQKKDSSLLLSQKENDELLKVIDSFSQLKNILRTGWIKRNVPLEYQETDTEHTMQMTSLATSIFKGYPDLQLDRKKVYEMILIHEIGEQVVGDIREGTKEHQTKYLREEQAVVNVFENIKSGDYFVNLWEEFEERKTEEATFTYQLDKIDPVLKAKILDKELGRDDLFLDFFNYEEERKTFKEGKVKELFYYIKERRL